MATSRPRATRTPPRTHVPVRDHTRLLGVYLNDHLAGSSAGVDLARRLAEEHGGTPVGAALEPFAAEVAEDRAALLGIMQELGVSVCHLKAATAWALEKVSRLKLSSGLLGPSPLSSLEELETMRVLVEGKAAGWRTLRVVARYDRRLDTSQLETLSARARRQSTLLEELHGQVAEELVTAS
jgi:hypothetical protein